MATWFGTGKMSKDFATVERGSGGGFSTLKVTSIGKFQTKSCRPSSDFVVVWVIPSSSLNTECTPQHAEENSPVKKKMKTCRALAHR